MRLPGRGGGPGASWASSGLEGQRHLRVPRERPAQAEEAPGRFPLLCKGSESGGAAQAGLGLDGGAKGGRPGRLAQIPWPEVTSPLQFSGAQSPPGLVRLRTPGEAEGPCPRPVLLHLSLSSTVTSPRSSLLPDTPHTGLTAVGRGLQALCNQEGSRAAAEGEGRVLCPAAHPQSLSSLLSLFPSPPDPNRGPPK